MAVNGCVKQSLSPHLEETDSLPAVLSNNMDSDQPLLLGQQRLNNSCEEESSMVVEYEEQATHVVEAYRSDVIQSNSRDQEHMSLASSYGPQDVLIMNGLAESGTTDRTDIPDVQTDNLHGRLAENSDNSTRVSADDKLDRSTASHDEMQSVSANCEASVLESSTAAQTDSNTTDIALSSDVESQAAGVAAADTTTYESPRDCLPVHEQLVSGTECISSASFDAVSMPRLRHDRHSVSSISSDTCASSINLGARAGSDILPSVTSDKLWSWQTRRERGGFDTQAVGVVRSSWSHENYFDDSDITCVDIDLDDDDLASSVDVLHYRDTAVSGDAQAHSWTEDDIGRGDSSCSGKLRSWAPLKGDEVFTELFSSSSESSLDDSDYSSAYTQSAASDFQKKAAKTYGVGVAIDFDPSEGSSDSPCDNFDDLSDDVISFSPSMFSDIATRPSTKDVDRPSAARLAKRLYYLQGFRKSDISRHLTKKYDFCTSCIRCVACNIVISSPIGTSFGIVIKQLTESLKPGTHW